MIKRHGMYTAITKEQTADREFTDWLFNSHSWVERQPGYAECEWCGKVHTSERPIHNYDPLCPQNPAVLALKKRNGQKNKGISMPLTIKKSPKRRGEGNRGLDVDFGFAVIDRARKENQLFYRLPHRIRGTSELSAKAMNLEAVRVLRNTINGTLDDLEFCIKNQRDETYLLEIGEGNPADNFTAVNKNNW